MRLESYLSSVLTDVKSKHCVGLWRSGFTRLGLQRGLAEDGVLRHAYMPKVPGSLKQKLHQIFVATLPFVDSTSRNNCRPYSYGLINCWVHLTVCFNPTFLTQKSTQQNKSSRHTVGLVTAAHTAAIVSRLNIPSQPFTKNLQCEDCQQLDSTIADVPLQALGLDESFHGYAKQSSN